MDGAAAPNPVSPPQPSPAAPGLPPGAESALKSVRFAGGCAVALGLVGFLIGLPAIVVFGLSLEAAASVDRFRVSGAIVGYLAFAGTFFILGRRVSRRPDRIALHGLLVLFVLSGLFAASLMFSDLLGVRPDRAYHKGVVPGALCLITLFAYLRLRDLMTLPAVVSRLEAAPPAPSPRFPLLAIAALAAFSVALVFINPLEGTRFARGLRWGMRTEPSRARTWVPFREETEKFRVDFPGQPVHETCEIPIPGSDITSHQERFTVKESEEVAFRVVVEIAPEGGDFLQVGNSLFEGVRDEIIARAPGEVTRPQFGYMGRLPTYEFTYIVERGPWMKVKLVATAGRLYHIHGMCMSGGDSDDVNRFVNSFRVLE